MDFTMGLSMMEKKHVSIMVVVDKLSKVVCFILGKSTYNTYYIERIFMKDIFKLHGIPKTIVSNRDVKFTSIFC